MLCINCGCELIETTKGNYLHKIKVNIGTVDKPCLVEGGVLLSKTTVCCYPEPETQLELVDNQKRIFRKRVLK